MANPRQRSKARSHKSTKPSLSVKRRMHHKLNKAPPLKGPEVLQGQWDKTKTVFQKYVQITALGIILFLFSKHIADSSYAALGLLPSIPLPQGPSSSRSHRAKLPFLPGQPAAGDDDDDEALKGAIVGYGRIIRDDEGNVIDIILPEDEAGAQGGEEQDAGSETEEPRVVEAKTEVVKCTCISSCSHFAQPLPHRAMTDQQRSRLSQPPRRLSSDTPRFLSVLGCITSSRSTGMTLRRWRRISSSTCGRRLKGRSRG
jgi:hypothetical protein